MIVAVCLNACIDRTVEIDSFQYGGMNRIKAARQDGSGKGVNVALAVRELGLSSACVGFLPEENAHLVTQRLQGAGCEMEFVNVAGDVRINTKVLDRKENIITELNEPGPSVGAEQLDAMVDLLRRWSERASAVVLTGSLPPGCPPQFYRTLMENCTARCLLDAEGEKLLAGLAAKPFLIKPNDYELELAVGRKLSTVEEIAAAARELIARGAGAVVVSMGAKGALYADEEECWFAPRIPIQVGSTVGAGDCMVSGMLYALEQGMPMKEVFRHGVAGGTAGCLTPGTELLRREDFFQMLERVEVRRVPVGALPQTPPRA